MQVRLATLTTSLALIMLGVCLGLWLRQPQLAAIAAQRDLAMAWREEMLEIRLLKNGSLVKTASEQFIPIIRGLRGSSGYALAEHCFNQRNPRFLVFRELLDPEDVVEVRYQGQTPVQIKSGDRVSRDPAVVARVVQKLADKPVTLYNGGRLAVFYDPLDSE